MINEEQKRKLKAIKLETEMKIEKVFKKLQRDTEVPFEHLLNDSCPTPSLLNDPNSTQSQLPTPYYNIQSLKYLNFSETSKKVKKGSGGTNFVTPKKGQKMIFSNIQKTLLDILKNYS